VDRVVEAVVVAQLPSGLYELSVDDTRVTAHLGSTVSRNYLRLVVGDRVAVELMPGDRTRGRIVRTVDRRR
jgi:translation initiation factor IF-1